MAAILQQQFFWVFQTFKYRLVIKQYQFYTDASIRPTQTNKIISRKTRNFYIFITFTLKGIVRVFRCGLVWGVCEKQSTVLLNGIVRDTQKVDTPKKIYIYTVDIFGALHCYQTAAVHPKCWICGVAQSAAGTPTPVRRNMDVVRLSDGKVRHQKCSKYIVCHKYICFLGGPSFRWLKSILSLVSFSCTMLCFPLPSL